MLTTALNLPFSIYHNFVIEEKYNMNKVTKTQFLKDQVKTFGVQCVIFAVLIPSLLFLIEKANEKTLILILSLAGATVVLNILVNCLLPTVILPLFFELEEFED